MPLIDRWLLYRLFAYNLSATEAYQQAQFGDVIHNTIHHFLHEVATFYLARIKDRLYCDPIDSFGVRSALTCLDHVYHTVAYQIAPILPHIVLEADQHRRLCFDGILQSTSSSDVDQFVREALFEGQIEGADAFEDIMKTVHQVIARLNKCSLGSINNLLAHDCHLVVGELELLEHLKFAQPEPSSRNSDLVEMLQVALVSYAFDEQLQLPAGVMEVHQPPEAVPKTEDGGSSALEQEEEKEEEEGGVFKIGFEPTKLCLCARCRRHQAHSSGQLCARCAAFE